MVNCGRIPCLFLPKLDLYTLFCNIQLLVLQFVGVLFGVVFCLGGLCSRWGCWLLLFLLLVNFRDDILSICWLCVCVCVCVCVVFVTLAVVVGIGCFFLLLIEMTGNCRSVGCGCVVFVTFAVVFGIGCFSLLLIKMTGNCQSFSRVCFFFVTFAVVVKIWLFVLNFVCMFMVIFLLNFEMTGNFSFLF